MPFLKIARLQIVTLIFSTIREDIRVFGGGQQKFCPLCIPNSLMERASASSLLGVPHFGQPMRVATQDIPLLHIPAHSFFSGCGDEASRINPVPATARWHTAPRESQPTGVNQSSPQATLDRAGPSQKRRNTQL